MTYTDVGLAVLVIVVILAMGFFLIPLLNRNGITNQVHSENIAQIIDFAKQVNNGSQLSQPTKDIVSKVFDVAKIAVSYVEQTMTDVDNSHKKLAAEKTVSDILNTMGVKVGESEKNLINIGIESAVNLMPKIVGNTSQPTVNVTMASPTITADQVAQAVSSGLSVSMNNSQAFGEP